MHCDIVTSGSTCGIHGCQRVTVTHKGGGDMVASAVLSEMCGMDANVEIANDPLYIAADAIDTKTSVDVSRKDGNGLRINFALVCQTNQGQWEYLMVNEGEVLLIDGEKVMVKRRI